MSALGFVGQVIAWIFYGFSLVLQFFVVGSSEAARGLTAPPKSVYSNDGSLARAVFRFLVSRHKPMRC